MTAPVPSSARLIAGAAGALMVLSAVPAAADAEGPGRFARPYAGIEAGYARGTARHAAEAPPGPPVGCNVGGTLHPPGTGRFRVPGSFIIRLAPLVSAPDPRIADIDLGQFVPAGSFGRVPVGAAVTRNVATDTGIAGPDRYRLDSLPAVPLGYPAGSVVALENAGGGGFDCGILVQRDPTLPAGTVALDLGETTGGSRITLAAFGPAGSPPPWEPGNFATEPPPQPPGSDLSGVMAGVLAGRSWALGGPWVGGIEGRLMSGDVATDGGGTKVGGMATLGGRIGIVQGRSFLYLAGGLAAARVDAGAGAGTGTGTGLAIGSGVEIALDDRSSLRLDVLHVDLGRESYGGRQAEVDFTLASIGWVMSF